MAQFQFRMVAVLLPLVSTFTTKTSYAQFIPGKSEENSRIIQKKDLPANGVTVANFVREQELYYYFAHDSRWVSHSGQDGFSGFYKSEDKGQTWKLLLNYFNFVTLFIDPKKGELFALIQDEHLISREDGYLTVANYSTAIRSQDGENWKSIMGKHKPVHGLRQIEMDPDNPNRVRLYGSGFRSFRLIAVDDDYSDWNFKDIPTGPVF